MIAIALISPAGQQQRLLPNWQIPMTLQATFKAVVVLNINFGGICAMNSAMNQTNVHFLDRRYSYLP